MTADTRPSTGSVYVVTQNDFTTAVFTTAEAARDFCDRQTKSDINRRLIHWRLDKFEVGGVAQGALDPATIEACAKFVEQHQETTTETANGSERSLSPRKVGNLMGLAYATGIRALLVPSTDRCALTCHMSGAKCADMQASIRCADCPSLCTCGGSIDQPENEHDISCPLALSSTVGK
jgi:hypothetical protein